MRYRDCVFVVAGWLLTGLPVARLAAAPGQLPAPQNVPTIVFDAETKRYDVSPGELVAPFSFHLTNVWTNEIIIDRVEASCDCTTADLPFNPWHLAPQAGGEVKAQVNLAGKMGLLTKTLRFYCRLQPDNTFQFRIVNLVVNIPTPPASAEKMTEAQRAAALNLAKADAQAIFKGDCAACHADKGREALGQELYAADCGICHESSHRDSLVPDLHALKQPTDFEYWRTIIALGKPHTMMPAFGVQHGGPLNGAQIDSLATYLNHTISHNLSPVMTNAATAPTMRAAVAP
jgi:mono/diheme cytochrome c family protein